MAVKPIPEGYHSLTPYLIVNGAAAAIEFYKQAFHAVEVLRLPTPAGTLAHAELRIGDAILMMADEFPEMGARGPKTIGGSPISMLIYTEDADAMFNRAVAAGAKVLRPMADQFYGDRSGTLEDPFGHTWSIATHTEDLSPAEIEARAAAAMQSAPPA